MILPALALIVDMESGSMTGGDNRWKIGVNSDQNGRFTIQWRRGRSKYQSFLEYGSKIIDVKMKDTYAFRWSR